jgi:hypothetical protein
MKSAKQLIHLISLLVFCLESINAQIEIQGTEFMLNKLRLNKGLEGIPSNLYEDIQGDPFIFRDFQKGILYVQPEGKYNVNIRYDIYANQMHLKDSNMIYAIIHPDKVKLIEAGNYKFIYSVFVNSPDDIEPAHSSYFIIKTGGKCMLLIKKSIRVQDAEPPKLYQEAKPPKFVSKADTYFLKTDGGSAVRIKNKKELLTLLADKSDVIDSYIISNKLGVKDIEDLEKIVSYYNSL